MASSVSDFASTTAAASAKEAAALALFLAGKTALQYWLGAKKTATLQPVGSLSQLIIYPVKSCLGVSIDSGRADEGGLVSACGILDRSFAVVSVASGKFISVKACPRLAWVQPLLDPTAPAGIKLSMVQPASPEGSKEEPPPMPPVSVSVETGGSSIKFDMFGQTVYGRACNSESAAWLRRACNRDDLLLVHCPRPDRSTLDELLECSRLGIASTAFANADFPASGDSRIAFANTAPLMLATEVALDGINRRLADKGRKAVDWRNFRPNLIVSGPLADRVEESWSFLFIGGCALAVLSPCTRCGLTTVDSDEAKTRSDGEPLRTLSEYRKDGALAKHSPVFGVNCFVERPGELRVGSKVLA